MSQNSFCRSIGMGRRLFVTDPRTLLSWVLRAVLFLNPSPPERRSWVLVFQGVPGWAKSHCLWSIRHICPPGPSRTPLGSFAVFSTAMVTDFLALSFALVELGSLTPKEGMASLSQSGLLLDFLPTASGGLHFLVYLVSIVTRGLLRGWRSGGTLHDCKLAIRRVNVMKKCIKAR